MSDSLVILCTFLACCALFGASVVAEYVRRWSRWMRVLSVLLAAKQDPAMDIYFAAADMISMWLPRPDAPSPGDDGL